MVVKIERLRDILIERRKEAEKEVVILGEKANSIQQQDFEPKSGQFENELVKAESLRDNKFSEIRKINLQIAAIDRGDFTGVCLSCGNEINDIEKHPLRTLCVGCQVVENGKGK